jgi:hypothetical protein
VLGLGFGLTFGLIVDPLQPNTLLQTLKKVINFGVRG